LSFDSWFACKTFYSGTSTGVPAERSVCFTCRDPAWQDYTQAQLTPCICRLLANRDDSSVLPEIYLHDQRVQDRTTNECLLFHGTSWSNINYLKKAGFTQYYRGTTPDKSLRFYDNSNKTMNVIPCAQCQRIDCVGCSSAAPFGLLICRVALGNPDEDIQSISGLTFPSTPDKDSVVCYSKSKQRSSKLDFSEYAIFDGSQAYVQYIAHVTKAPTATTTTTTAAARS